MLKALFGPRVSGPDFGSDVSRSPMLPADLFVLVDILCNAALLTPFTTTEAKIAATYMTSRHFKEREVMIEQGARTDIDFMLWVLEGEATFEAVTPGTRDAVTVTVLGVGHALGIMSLIDGAPRSLQGVATVPTRCAVLTRSQLQALCREHASIGVKLMCFLCLIVSAYLRDLTGKFKCHVRLNNALSAELRGRESAPIAL